MFIFFNLKPDPQEAKIQNEIQNIITLTWEGGTFQDEEKKGFYKIMTERRFRKYFFTCLNKYRISGLFILSEKSFKILGEILYQILNEVIFKFYKFQIL